MSNPSFLLPIPSTLPLPLPPTTFIIPHSLPSLHILSLLPTVSMPHLLPLPSHYLTSSLSLHTLSLSPYLTLLAFPYLTSLAFPYLTSLAFPYLTLLAFSFPSLKFLPLLSPPLFTHVGLLVLIHLVHAFFANGV